MAAAPAERRLTDGAAYITILRDLLPPYIEARYDAGLVCLLEKPESVFWSNGPTRGDDGGYKRLINAEHTPPRRAGHCCTDATLSQPSRH